MSTGVLKVWICMYIYTETYMQHLDTLLTRLKKSFGKDGFIIQNIFQSLVGFYRQQYKHIIK